MNCVLILALFVAIASCFTEQEYQTQFTQWMQSNKKSYGADEFHARYQIFRKNMDYVSQWNSVNQDTKRMFITIIRYPECNTDLFVQLA